VSLLRVEEVTVDDRLDPRVRVFRGDDGWDGDVDSYAIVGDERVAFVDAHATPAQARAVRAALEPELATREALLVLTHADFDHVWGAAGFAVPMVAHAAAAARLASAEAQAEVDERQARDADYAEVVLLAPDETFEQSRTLDLGGLTLELAHAPGHSDDHITVWIPELRVLLAGDAAELPFPHVPSAASLATMEETLARLEAYAPELVLPCHGKTTEPNLLARNRAYLAAVRAAVAARPLPADWQTRDDLEAVFAFPLDEAVRAAGADPAGIAHYYALFHREALRAACEARAAA
jgi:glyoxylase-like metal-dependent hydrolase (beta-lactamase superfamily II)